MKFTDLKNDIQSGARAIYLLEGDDAYFRIKGEEMIKQAFLQMPELNFTAFDGEALKGNSISNLTSALQSVPFMSERRIVKVADFYPSESDYEHHLKKVFENMPSESILIIVNTEGKKGVDLKRKQCVTYIDCNRADEDSVAKWAYLTFKRAGIAASVELCMNIARFCLCNMSRVALEVEKLIDYKKEGELTRDEVESLVFKENDYRIYEMTNAVARRDFDRFVAIEGELCRKEGDETSLLSGMFSYFKNLLTVLSSSDSDAELSKFLKMKEYGVKKSREQARAIGGERLKKIVPAIYNALSAVKGGLTTPKNALQSVNNLLFFCNC